MDATSLTQERIARQRIEEERRARPVSHLSPLQKQVLLKAANGDYDNPNNGLMENTPEGAALHSLGDYGLVKLILVKGGLGGRLTDKGRLLLHENPKLRFAPAEGTRWIITTIISVLALIVATVAMIRTFL